MKRSTYEETELRQRYQSRKICGYLERYDLVQKHSYAGTYPWCWVLRLELKLTPFHGHLVVLTEGVRDAQSKPPYPAQFREQMVELVHAGKKPAELVKKLGYHATSILSWVRLADVASGVVPTQSGALSAAEHQELIELSRKLRQVETGCPVASEWLMSMLVDTTS